MWELAFFLAHCFATFGLAAVAFAEIAVGKATLGAVPREIRQDAVRNFLGGVSRVIVPLALLEMASGIVLLAFPRWRASAFAPTMAIVAAIWIWEWIVGRKAKANLLTEGSDVALSRWAKVLWFPAAAWILRSVSLAVIALI
jgi:hypothetical protein